MCFSAVQLVTARENVFCVFWEEANFSLSSPKTHSWARAHKKSNIPLSNIQAGGMLHPITLSVQSTIKLWLQSKIHLLHLRGRTPTRRHVSLTADWSVLWSLMLSLPPPSPWRNKEREWKDFFCTEQQPCVCVYSVWECYSMHRL